MVCTAAVLAALLVGGGVLAQQPSVRLGEGETLAAYGWSGSAEMLLVVQQPAGYSAQALTLADAQLAELEMPVSFGWITPPANGAQQVDFSIAPGGDALAVLEHSINPLIAPELHVYQRSGEAFSEVSLRKLPDSLWPQLLAWDASGKKLYISSRPYLFPEQLYSIGCLELPLGTYQPVMLKGNLDLVQQMVFIPQRDALAVLCRGFQGEYPPEPVVALVDLTTRKFSLLHSRAGNHLLAELGNGQLIIAGLDSGGSLLQDDCWTLMPEEYELSPTDLQLVESPGSLRVSPDGKWIGFIRRGGLAEGADAGSEAMLVLQRTADDHALVTSVACRSFEFAPSGSYAAAAGLAGKELFFFQLPDG